MRIRFAAARRSRRAALGTLLVLVLSALLVPPTTASSVGSDPQSVQDEQWWLGTLGIETIWEKHTRGEGVVVAVIDTGVHPGGDLEGAVLEGFNIDGSGPGNVGDDQEFHGTTIATEIAGRGTGQGVIGVAPEAMILPVKVPTLNQSNYTAKALMALAEMDDPPEIVNMSYGGVGQCSPEEKQAVRAAVDRGMILVASMGNDHTGQELAKSPASCPGVIAVGAFGSFGTLANGDPDIRLWQKSEQRDYATFAAPGMHMIAFAPGSDKPIYFDGTSDAAAIASGSLALVRAKFPDMSSREVVARALATTRHPNGGPGTHDEEWGYGVLRPRHAIEDDVPSDAENPVYDALDEAVPPTTSPESSASPEPADEQSTESNEDDSGADRADEDSDDDGNGALIAGLIGGGAVVLVLLIGMLVLIARRLTNSGGLTR